MELKGKIYKIRTEQQVTDSFKKREFVLNTDLETDYPQFIQLEFVQDKCEILDKYKVGDIITVQINIRGRNWQPQEGEEKTFNTLQAWRIEKDEQQQEQTTTPPTNAEAEDDDLPF